jgi:HAMP domain-containing protein
MNPEELLAECREMGQVLRKEIAAARKDIDRLARSLKLAFDATASKEDIGRLENAIAALTNSLSRNA